MTLHTLTPRGSVRVGCEVALDGVELRSGSFKSRASEKRQCSSDMMLQMLAPRGSARVGFGVALGDGGALSSDLGVAVGVGVATGPGPSVALALGAAACEGDDAAALV